jgi:hypothetical protein
VITAGEIIRRLLDAFPSWPDDPRLEEQPDGSALVVAGQWTIGPFGLDGLSVGEAVDVTDRRGTTMRCRTEDQVVDVVRGTR